MTGVDVENITDLGICPQFRTHHHRIGVLDDLVRERFECHVRNIFS